MGVQKVDFDAISDSCANLTSLTESVDKTIDVVDSAVNRIKNPAWEGKAASNFKETLKKLTDNIPVFEQQLALSVLFLASCADGYKKLGEDSVKKLKDLIGGQEYIDNFDVSKVKDIFDTTSTTDTPDTDTTKNIDTNSNSNNSSNNTNSYYSNSSSSNNSGYTYTSSSYSSPYTASTLTYTSTPTTVSNVTNLVHGNLTGKTIEIPSSVSQGGYTVTGYDYWISSGERMVWASGTNQEKVAEIWKKQGSRFKNGIAIITVDGEDRYLVAVTTKFGQVGDCIDVTLEDGTVIKCIIGDSKGSDAGSEWGHQLGGGKINVLEFEVQRSKYMSSGNPTTDKWGLEWNSSCPVKSITNKGSIIGATLEEGNVVANLATQESISSAREAIVNVAAGELNNTNETKYVEMFGEPNGTAWCSEFVAWCAKKSGYVDAGIIPKFAGADEGAAWFQKQGLFQDRNYTPSAGDILFTGGGSATHTALVASVENGVIHTIEGNVGDKVKKCTHKVGDSNIYGYGTPDYSKLVKTATA